MKIIDYHLLFEDKSKKKNRLTFENEKKQN